MLRWLVHSWMDCDRALALIGESLDRRISLCKQVLVHAHLRVCPVCSRHREQLTLIPKPIPDFHDASGEVRQDDLPKLSAEAKIRMQQMIKEWADAYRSNHGSN